MLLLLGVSPFDDPWVHVHFDATDPEDTNLCPNSTRSWNTTSGSCGVGFSVGWQHPHVPQYAHEQYSKLFGRFVKINGHNDTGGEESMSHIRAFTRLENSVWI